MPFDAVTVTLNPAIDRTARIDGETRTGIKITDPLTAQTTDINFPGTSTPRGSFSAAAFPRGAILRSTGTTSRCSNATDTPSRSIPAASR